MEKIRLLSLCAPSSTFANSIAKSIEVELTPVDNITFSKGEVKSYPLGSVRGCRCFIIAQYNEENVNSQMMRIFILADALKRASAAQIILVVPFLPYMRQDYRSQPREPISAKLIAELLKTAGVNHIVTYDLHGKSAEGFFERIDNPGFTTLMSDYLKNHSNYDLSNLVISTGDEGGTTRVKKLARKLKIPFVVVSKTRKQNGEIDEIILLGNVTGKNVIIFDDITDTGGTLVETADILLENGAKSVSAAVTHLFKEKGLVRRLNNSNIKKVFTSDSMFHKNLPKKFIEISLIQKTSDMIKQISEDKPVDLS
jgi:ribose-phosphate pyrophosphokinase